GAADDFPANRALAAGDDAIEYVPRRHGLTDTEDRHERSGSVAIWSKGRSSWSRSRLHVGLRQLVRERGAGRRARGGAQFAAKGQVRPLRRAALRLAVHRAAVDQPALLALSHPAHGQTLGALPQDRQGVDAHRAGGAGGERFADRPTALGTDPDTTREAHL